MNIEKNIHLLDDHPLVTHWLTFARNKNTVSYNFRTAFNNICRLLAYEITKNYIVSERIIDTPVKDNVSFDYLDCKVVLVPILRAGLSMLNEFLDLSPKAEINILGIERYEETLETQFYYHREKIDLNDKIVVILDPMIATGNSLLAAYEKLNVKFKPKSFIVGSIVMSQSAKELLIKTMPEVKVYSCACDPVLNKKGYIIPGLGDAGDRFFHT